MYVLKSAYGSVYEVFTFSGTIYTPCHRNLIVIHRKTVVTVVKGDCNIGRALWLSKLGSRKYYILHLGTSETLGTLLTKNPSHRITYVTLT